MVKIHKKINNRNEKTNYNKKEEDKLSIGSFAIFALVVLTATVLSASNILAFKIGNFEFSLTNKPNENAKDNPDEGLNIAEERVLDRNNDMNSNEIERNSIKEMNRNRVNSIDAIRFANSNKYVNNFLSDYEGDSFCFVTDERKEYITIEDGLVYQLDYKPNRCYKISTSEDFVSYAWNKGNNGEQLSMSEINDNVKIPFRLKAKMLISRFNIFS